jgi:hypothetical protein
MKNEDGFTTEQAMAAAFANKAKKLEKEGKLPAFLAEMERKIPGARQELLDALNDHARRTGQDGW